jgi:hypothetical protein
MGVKQEAFAISAFWLSQKHINVDFNGQAARHQQNP